MNTKTDPDDLPAPETLIVGDTIRSQMLEYILANQKREKMLVTPLDIVKDDKTEKGDKAPNGAK